MNSLLLYIDSLMTNWELLQNPNSWVLAQMMWFVAQAGIWVVPIPWLHAFLLPCRVQLQLAVLESQQALFYRLLMFPADRGSNFVQCFVWSEKEYDKILFYFSVFGLPQRGHCDFSNCWLPLLLLTAVSSISWYSLLPDFLFWGQTASFKASPLPKGAVENERTVLCTP